VNPNAALTNYQALQNIQNMSLGLPDSNLTFKMDRRSGSKEDQ
jgi:hypothetical protein